MFRRRRGGPTPIGPLYDPTPYAGPESLRFRYPTTAIAAPPALGRARRRRRPPLVRAAGPALAIAVAVTTLVLALEAWLTGAWLDGAWLP